MSRIINFLPAGYRDRQLRQRRLLRQGLILALAATLILAGHVGNLTRLGRMESRAHRLENEAALLKLQLDQAGRLQNQLAGLERQVRVRQELTPNLTQAQIIACIGELLPRSMSLTYLRIEDRSPAAQLRDMKTTPPTAGRSVGAATAPGKNRAEAPPAVAALALAGLAPSDVDVANFMGALAEHPLFTGVKLVSSRPVEVEGLAAREFRIEMDVPMDRRVVPPQAQEVARAH